MPNQFYIMEDIGRQAVTRQANRPSYERLRRLVSKHNATALLWEVAKSHSRMLSLRAAVTA